MNKNLNLSDPKLLNSNILYSIYAEINMVNKINKSNQESRIKVPVIWLAKMKWYMYHSVLYDMYLFSCAGSGSAAN